MTLFIGIIVAFLVLVYVYTFVKIHKKRKNNNINEVVKYKKQYINKKQEHSENSNYEKYITKYNSQIDYVEKNDL